MPNRHAFTSLFATAITLLTGLSLFASTIKPLDLTTLDAKASLVVTGYVVKVEAVRDDPAVLEQTAVIRVSSVLRGTYSARTLRVRMRIGLVFFDRMLVKGDSGVFYLKQLADGRFEAAYPGSFALFRQGTVRPLTP